MTHAFVPRPFPRTRLSGGRTLTDAQQHQYDVLRTVGGKLVSDPHGWWCELDDGQRSKIFGLNLTAMWKLVDLGLVVCTDDAPRSHGYLFLLPDLAKSVPGPRYHCPNRVVKEIP
jgi:hypothetical protein